MVVYFAIIEPALPGSGHYGDGRKPGQEERKPGQIYLIVDFAGGRTTWAFLFQPDSCEFRGQYT
jgi:hypothetical protein